MKLYHYNEETMEIRIIDFDSEGNPLYTTEARLDPEESKMGNEVYLIPGHATTKPMLEPKENTSQIFINGNWQYIENHRGKEAWVKATAEKVVIQTLGSISAEITLTPPPDETHSWIDGEWKVDAEKVKSKEEKEITDKIKNELNALLAQQAVDNLIERGELVKDEDGKLSLGGN